MTLEPGTAARVEVRTAGGGYPVLVGTGLLYSRSPRNCCPDVSTLAARSKSTQVLTPALFCFVQIA